MKRFRPYLIAFVGLSVFNCLFYLAWGPRSKHWFIGAVVLAMVAPVVSLLMDGVSLLFMSKEKKEWYRANAHMVCRPLKGRRLLTYAITLVYAVVACCLIASFGHFGMLYPENIGFAIRMGAMFTVMFYFIWGSEMRGGRMQQPRNRFQRFMEW